MQKRDLSPRFRQEEKTFVGLLRSRVAEIKRSLVGERSAVEEVQLARDATLVKESTSD